MIILPLRPYHLRDMTIQPSQAYAGPMITDEYAREICRSGVGFAGLAHGFTVCCAGVLPQWEGRAIAWALFSKDAGRHLHAITKAVKTFLETQRIRRIETWVDATYPPAIRWIEMLGFQREAEMRAYGPQGQTGLLYARIWE